MLYRVVTMGRFTFRNNAPEIKYEVQMKILGFLWIPISKWYTQEEAEKHIKSRRRTI